MKILVLYDSKYGNTRSIAHAIAGAFGDGDKVKLVSVNKVKLRDLKSVNLFIVGSPTRGGRATPAIQKFLNSIPDNAFKHVKIASFDTRIEAKNSNVFMKMILGIFGYAAPKIAKLLNTKGAHTTRTLLEVFFVTGKKGPLKSGELSRAAKWAMSVRASML